jgi:hypothetical protein
LGFMVLLVGSYSLKNSWSHCSADGCLRLPGVTRAEMVRMDEDEDEGVQDCRDSTEQNTLGGIACSTV